MRADRVEVTQQHHIPLVIALPQVGQNPLLKRLGGAVRIRRLPERAFLRDRNLRRIAVHRGRTGEDKILAPVRPHHIAQNQRGVQIVAVILQRLSRRLSDRLVSGKMNDRINLILGKYLVQCISVLHIDLIEFRPLSRDFLNPVQHHRLGIIEIVRNHHIHARVLQFNAGMASNKSGTASHKNCHIHSFPLHNSAAPAQLCSTRTAMRHLHCYAAPALPCGTPWCFVFRTAPRHVPAHACPHLSFFCRPGQEDHSTAIPANGISQPCDLCRSDHHGSTFIRPAILRSGFRFPVMTG